MLQRDYFIRIIQEFMAALAAFLEKEKDTPDKGLKELYRQYVGDYDTLRNLTTDELLGYAKEQWKAEERVDRIEMVAELLYAEASLRQNPLRDMLMQKLSGPLTTLTHIATPSLLEENKKWLLYNKS